jgi:ATP-dependent protease HslVU (ClpYQ) peptidase subunit
MTCIVGIGHQGRVYIGGDSAGVAGLSITVRADEKVFTVGPYAMGFTTSFRMGQLLRYRLEPPDPGKTKDLDGFMVTNFVDAVRECMSDGGWLTRNDGQEEGGTFLVGIRGTLYSIESDFQIGRPSDDYAAVGCGDDLALGALHATRGQSPRERIKTALRAAAHHSAGVTAPFVIKRAGE